MAKYAFDRKRPISWSYISSFEYDREEWFRRYILKIEDRDTAELRFGKEFALSCERGTPLAPVTLAPDSEYPFNVMVDGMHLRGFLDGFDASTCRTIIEYKTGVKPWTQKRVDEHGQLTFYCLMNYAKHKIRPEECEIILEWIPTKRTENGSFETLIEFASDPPQVVPFRTRRTMTDIALLVDKIHRTLDEMERFVAQHE